MFCSMYQQDLGFLFAIDWVCVFELYLNEKGYKMDLRILIVVKIIFKAL